MSDWAAQNQLEKLLQALEALAGIEKDILDRKMSHKIKKKVDAFEMLPAISKHKVLGQIGATHLLGNSELYETSLGGIELAKLIGSAPPDFTLQDLDGNSVNIRETIKGKVAYLNFWESAEGHAVGRLPT